MAELLDILMFITVCVVLIMGFPVAFALAGVAFVFGAIAISIGVMDDTFLRAMPNRIFGTMTNEVLIAVPLFVFMGVMLERSKVAEELLDNMARLFGTLRGGLGISVSIVGALLAASTGIVGATVVTMGLLSLPTMLRRGYDPSLACGSICAAGTLGQIIPPSIVLVLLGDQISIAYQQVQLQLQQEAYAKGDYSFFPDTVSVGDLFAGALIPGLCLVGLYIVYQIFVAIFSPKSSPSVPQEDDDAGTGLIVRTAKALVPPVVLIIAVLGSILGGFATPTEAAAVGAIGSILLAGMRLGKATAAPTMAALAALIGMLLMTGMFDLRVTRRDIPTEDMAMIALAVGLGLVLAYGLVISLVRAYQSGVLFGVMRSTAEISTMVFTILIGATLFSLVFRGLGGEETVHELLSGMPGGVVGAMIIVMAVMFLMGFFLDFIEITFVVVPLVAPVLLAMGLDPVWLGVMMAMNLQTSFLTPPFGFALFYLRGVAPDSITTLQIYRGVMPFIVIQVFALIVLALFPGLATWLPSVIFP